MRTFLVLAGAAFLTSCASARVDSSEEALAREGEMITREEIQRSGARDGWEALRLGSTHLSFQYARQGTAVRVTHRGVSSFLINPQVLLVIDGTHMQSLSVLESIPAENIDYIHILSARAGVLKYGTSAGNGVVVVKTGVPPSVTPGS